VVVGEDLLGELGAGPVNLLKVDVEGHELPVLRGLRRTIEGDGPVVLCEVPWQLRVA
jgi:FkbM family methyltransferase